MDLHHATKITAVRIFMNILFLTRSLNYGGSERQLTLLATELLKRGQKIVVATFYPGGALRNDLSMAGVPTISLEKRSRWQVVGFVVRLIRYVRQLRPQILHSYLGTANILSVVLKPLFPFATIVWGVRASNMELEQYGWMDRLLYRIERGLSRFAGLIIVNSQSGFDYAVAHGFPRKRMVVIHNGIDVERFRPDLDARHRWRKDWGIAQTDVLVGLVGRIDPMKGHETFLRAGALLAKERDNVRFVCVGNGSSAFRRTLQSLAEQLGLHTRLLWIDSCSNLVEMYNAMDVVTSSSSFGEGFSNVIGEAMACGVPCVVTNVGDSALIVGSTGVVVPPRDSQALAAGWSQLLDRQAREPGVGILARTRIIEHFALDRLVEATQAALSRL
jgi:glycosyltransferase involved in cell wall biosynthesis